MYAEILKIIEAGITNDRQKTINYSRKLADYYLENGQKNVSQKIIKLIEERNNNLASLDGLSARPFDKETKMEMIDLTFPTESTDK